MVRRGKPERAVEEVAEERLGARHKHTSAFPQNALRWLLEDNGLRLRDVTHVAGEAASLVERQDEVALAAVIARLVRVGEASLTTLLEFSYRQI